MTLGDECLGRLGPSATLLGHSGSKQGHCEEGIAYLRSRCCAPKPLLKSLAAIVGHCDELAEGNSFESKHAGNLILMDRAFVCACHSFTHALVHARTHARTHRRRCFGARLKRTRKASHDLQGITRKANKSVVCEDRLIDGWMDGWMDCLLTCLPFSIG